MSAWYEREEDLEASLNRSALWSITYGDLMSYLAIFFLLLFAAASTRSVSMQMNMTAIEESVTKEGTVMDQLFSKHGIQQIAKLEVGEDRMRIVFSEPVLFDAGSDRLKEASRPHLARLAQALGELPNPVQVEGHTDDRPLGPRAGFRSNWELSAARAFAVLRALEEGGLPSSRLSALGYGEHRPVASNETPEGRTANRRIEISLIRRRE